jgi:hypothetical protein
MSHRLPGFGRAALSGVLLVAIACASPAPTATLEQVSAGPAGWRKLPDPPLSARYDASAFWTGQEVIVLGGTDAVPCPGDCPVRPRAPLADVTALDPAAGVWRPLTQPPQPLGSIRGAVLSGTLYLVDDAVPPSFLGYRVDEDRWDVLPKPKGDHFGGLVAAGSRLVALGGSEENGIVADQVYDPESKGWADLPRDPLAPSFDRSMVWTGRDLVLLGIRLDSLRPPNAAPVYSAAVLDHAQRWQRLPDSDVVGWSPTWFFAGGSIVNPSLGSADGGATNNWGRAYPFGGILMPPARWVPLPEIPPGPRDGVFGGISVGGGDYVVSSAGWALHVPTSRWIPIVPPPERIDTGVAAVWAGDELIGFGGVRWDGERSTILGSAWAWRP